MRVSDLISLGMDYLAVGIAAAVLFIAAAVVYAKWYKKENGTLQKAAVRKMLLYCVFICYIVVVLGATTLSRFGYYENVIRLQPFYSYKEAWNDFSVIEWRNIILNILMFVPFGFLLPFLWPKFEKTGWTYLAGFAMTALIEGLQLVLRRGIFETDDLLNNLLGTMIGYGFYRLWMLVYDGLRRKTLKGGMSQGSDGHEERRQIWSVLCCQIPLVICIAAFSGIFIFYERQELGNLRSSYIVRQKIADVTTELRLSEEEGVQPVYQVPVLTLEEAKARAKEFFAGVGDVLDESSEDAYENTVLYSSENEKSLWIYYKGGTYAYTDFALLFGETAQETDPEADREEIYLALNRLGVEVPEGMSFEKYSGMYRLDADLLLQDGLLYDGTIYLGYTQKGNINSIDYSMLACTPYKEFEVISEAEAYRRLTEGEFYYFTPGEWSIEVYDVSLVYDLDSKGFYQPSYRFDAVMNGQDSYIIIPAVK